MRLNTSWPSRFAESVYVIVVLPPASGLLNPTQMVRLHRWMEPRQGGSPSEVG